MTSTARKVLESALMLSEADRTAVADELLASMEPSIAFDEAEEAEFIKELERRAAELEANPSAGIPWKIIKELR